jgi:D-aminopeptidase
MQDHIMTALEAILSSDKNPVIEEVVIADSHSHGDNLYYELTELYPRISLYPEIHVLLT